MLEHRSPLVSVIVPVHNRPSELRRALQSVAEQSLEDFECVVVDDASHDQLDSVVAGFDRRFRYLRREENGGCTATRLEGFRRSTGQYALTLDSDNELLPWTLERAVAILDAHPEADCVTGLYIFPEGFRVRVPSGTSLVQPSDYATSSTLGGADCLGMVRRSVVDLWMSRRTDYFSLDFQLWFAMSLEHPQLYVDEPWGRFHEDATIRISASVDERRFEDRRNFVEQFRPELGTRQCRPLDEFLESTWLFLRRAGKREHAAQVADWMTERGLSPRRAVLNAGQRKIRRRFAGAVPKTM